MYDLLLAGLADVMQVKYLVPLVLGTLVGVIGGALPGVTITLTIIVALPFTFGLDPLQGLSAMVGIYVGGSAGGLLMGAVVNQSPETFKAVIAQVPFVDVMNTMLDETLPLTTGEWIEWGNPNEKKAWDYMITYSPYENVKKQNYPNMLIEVSLNDSQVPYWEGAKFAAKIREMKTGPGVILLKTNMGAGHGGSSGRYDRLKEVAFDYAYALAQVGITK